MPADKTRIDNEPGFVLHTRPYRETSLIADVFTRAHGAFSLVARGARRPRSETRGVLMPFQPVLLSWFGKTELRTLHKVEWQGGIRLLGGRALMSGFYVNELMLRLVPRDVPHEGLFDRYQETVRALSLRAAHADVLRRFELALLTELGYGVTLHLEADGRTPVDPGGLYDYFIEQGPVRVQPGGAPSSLYLRGQTLLDMHRGDYADPQTQLESRQLMRGILSFYLDGKSLFTPKLAKDLQSF